MDIRKQFWMAACAALFICGGTAMAQEADKDMPDRSEKHYKPVPLSPEKSARQTTDRMDSLLNLTKKQYDKLYKLNLKWARGVTEMKNGRGTPHGPKNPERDADFRDAGGFGQGPARKPSARRHGPSSAPAISRRQATGENGETA